MHCATVHYRCNKLKHGDVEKETKVAVSTQAPVTSLGKSLGKTLAKKDAAVVATTAVVKTTMAAVTTISVGKEAKVGKHVVREVQRERKVMVRWLSL